MSCNLDKLMTSLLWVFLFWVCFVLVWVCFVGVFFFWGGGGEGGLFFTSH